MRLQLRSIKYRTFHVGLLADYDEELIKALVEIWKCSTHFSNKVLKN